MNVHIVHDGSGEIASVHRSVDGAAHQLVGHGPGAVMEDGSPVTIEGLDEALDANPVVRITYGDAPGLTVERHPVVV